ncbi:MAG: hypothetical protein J5744_02255 [Oscillospiraceae bacterium]|nr:hypothetical protein [Oscillospiraceae bacterium]
MADNRDNGYEGIEERLRSSMPLLEVPESLSASSVAQRLKAGSTRKRTPIYVYVRAAVAACLVFAIGFGAVMISRGSFSAKGAESDGYAVESSSEPSYDVKENSADDDQLSVTEGTGSDITYNAQSGILNRPDSGNEAPAELALRAGETYSAVLDVKFGEAEITTDSEEDGEAVCTAELTEEDGAAARIVITGGRSGTQEITVTENGETAYVFLVRVTE